MKKKLFKTKKNNSFILHRVILIFGLWVGFLANSCVSEKNRSNFQGVQIGTITYSYRSMPDQSLPAILDYAVESGIGSVELMGTPLEEYAGIPEGREEIVEWRKTVSMDKFKEIRKMFNDKGVNIHIVKMRCRRWADEEIDYAFNVCRALGAMGITMEISEEAAERLAPFAEKHNLYVIFHNHGQPGEPGFNFEKFLAYSPKMMLNFDVGHFYGATGIHPNVILEKLHNRIASIHIKDKTGPDAAEPDTNRPFGQGDTPVADILNLIKEKQWPIVCDIELEYPVPEGSDAVTEVAKCVEYCRNALED